MPFDKKFLKKSKKAVSEIIGNLLILGITVTLFSGVLIYVSSMPKPSQTTSADFSTIIQSPIMMNGTNIDATLNIKMVGGQTLKSYDTSIAVLINNTVYNGKSLTMGDSINKLGAEWTTGENWTYTLLNIPANAVIEILIVEKTANNVIYQAKVAIPSNSFPVIGTRYQDPLPGIIGEFSSIYVSVYDYDGYITNVSMDMAGVGGSSHVALIPNPLVVNGWMSPQQSVTTSWVNGVITLFASDDKGQNTYARMSLSAVANGTATRDDSGDQPKNIIYSKNDGYNFFRYSEWVASNFNATPTYAYSIAADGKPNMAVVVVSKSLLNLNNKNYLSIMTVDDKEIVYQADGAVAFERYQFKGGYYSYVAKVALTNPPFNTNDRYMVQIWLEDNSQPSNKIYIIQNITTGSGGSYPTFNTYKNSTDTFTTKEYYNNEVFYIKITGDATSLPSNMTYFASGGELILRDFEGGTQIKTAASATATVWNGAVSGVTRVGTGQSYTLQVNLSAAKLGDPWISGKNAYTFSFDMFTISNGLGYYKTYYLTSYVNITSPVFSGGIAAGICQGVTPAIPSYGATQGLTAWVQSSSMLYYVNDNSWTPPEYLEPFNQWSDYRPQSLLTLSGDVNGDGENNEVVSYLTLTVRGSNTANTNAPYYETFWVPKIALYTRDSSGSWSSSLIKSLVQTGSPAPSGTSFVQVKSMALGNVDMDNDKDLVYGMSNGSLALLRNDGSWTYRELCDVGKNIIAVALADLDAGVTGHDKNRSLDIVFATSDGFVYTLRNTDGMGTFSSPRVQFISATTLTYATSLVVGDLDNDKRNDLLVVGGWGSSGTKGNVFVAYNPQINIASPLLTKVLASDVTAFNLANAPKTNVTLGNYLTKDVYPDVAIAVGGVGVSAYGGVYLIKHASGSGYDAPIRTITNIASEADGACVAKIQCMITADIDSDGLMDLIVSTGDWRVTSNRNEWRGNVLIFLNVDGAGTYARYVVDTTGVPVRSVAVVI